jgi:hypothetical protein
LCIYCAKEVSLIFPDYKIEKLSDGI